MLTSPCWLACSLCSVTHYLPSRSFPNTRSQTPPMTTITITHASPLRQGSADAEGVYLIKMGQMQQTEVLWELMCNNFNITNNCGFNYQPKFMKEDERWKNADIQNGDYDTPVGVSLSFHCAFMCSGHSFLSCWHTLSGYFAQKELGGHIVASWFSKWNFLCSGSDTWRNLRASGLKAGRVRKWESSPRGSMKQGYSHHIWGDDWERRLSSLKDVFPGQSMKDVYYFDENSSSMSSKRIFWS